MHQRSRFKTSPLVIIALFLLSWLAILVLEISPLSILLGQGVGQGQDVQLAAKIKSAKLAKKSKSIQKNQQFAGYLPKQIKVKIHPTNYGKRVSQDIRGKSVHHDLLIVLHETTAPVESAINYFQTPHYADKEQVSYHAAITLEGMIIYFLVPEQRAYGAGNSAFQGEKGLETVQTNPHLPPSVNNFAYHISLETPPDGYNNKRQHSGYTQAQYRSLAWLVAKTGVLNERIVTHQAVDRSGERQDPRTFSLTKLLKILNAMPLRKNAIANASPEFRQLHAQAAKQQ